ncbi:uncharacterized protein BXZ73DRAFT_108669 [Epithele typhae]|uniref:uncharacterized protein n=1 Tax=Epithele typhae TaxID=378194 RepID=UPI0020080035|nr:uncharacterized protein BXZ73DRAFT_108669 [Epithele typhae]KAH9910666.1 hypothetical protein BXZ73DRAFT_108669 [Epithele typhae]
MHDDSRLRGLDAHETLAIRYDLAEVDKLVEAGDALINLLRACASIGWGRWSSKGILTPEVMDILIDEGINETIPQKSPALERIMQSPEVKSPQASNEFAVPVDGGIRSDGDIFPAIAPRGAYRLM